MGKRPTGQLSERVLSPCVGTVKGEVSPPTLRATLDLKKVAARCLDSPVPVLFVQVIPLYCHFRRKLYLIELFSEKY